MICASTKLCDTFGGIVVAGRFFHTFFGSAASRQRSSWPLRGGEAVAPRRRCNVIGWGGERSRKVLYARGACPKDFLKVRDFVSTRKLVFKRACLGKQVNSCMGTGTGAAHAGIHLKSQTDAFKDKFAG